MRTSPRNRTGLWCKDASRNPQEFIPSRPCYWRSEWFALPFIHSSRLGLKFTFNLTPASTYCPSCAADTSVWSALNSRRELNVFRIFQKKTNRQPTWFHPPSPSFYCAYLTVKRNPEHCVLRLLFSEPLLYPEGMKTKAKRSSKCLYFPPHPVQLCCVLICVYFPSTSSPFKISIRIRPVGNWEVRIFLKKH